MKIKEEEPLKAYYITEEEDSAEINMYGQVVSSRPIDWWTGKPTTGLFIVLKEFLEDLEQIKNKKNITFRINSPGGELYAGISIYNRMKELKGTVTTIVDGLAASAASIIAQGGKIRKMCKGTQMMIHSASCFIFGNYNIQDLEQAVKRIKSANDSVIEIYMDATGKDRESIEKMVRDTTWMGTDTAIKNGFADEIDEQEEEVEMSLTDKNILMVNGIPLPVGAFLSLPKGIIEKQALTTGHIPDVINKKNKRGKKRMTPNELKEQYPEAINQIIKEAIMQAKNEIDTEKEKAVMEERKRIQEIEKIENAVNDKRLIQKAKYGTEVCTAKDLAFLAMQQQSAIGAQFSDSLKEDFQLSGASQVIATPNQGQMLPQDETEKDTEEGAKLIAKSFMEVR